MPPKTKSIEPQVISKKVVSKNVVSKNIVSKNVVSKNVVSKKGDVKNAKGGAKAADDPDMNSTDDYDTDDQSNEDDDEDADDTPLVVPIKETNSDDDLEQKEKSDEDDQSEDNEDQEEIHGDGEDGCIYRFTGKKNKNVDILADFEAEDDFSDDDDKNVDVTRYVDPSKRITKNFMTIYERVRLLGERSKQLSLGAKPMIKGVENMNPKEIAKLEMEKKVIPLIIIRTLPNGVKEKWKVHELEIIN